MNPVGTMQGRLLPKYKKRYQAHPVGYWSDEFAIAKSIGLNCIEFIVDYDAVERNPLIYSGGLTEIESHIDQSGVRVRSICADYFMDAPLHSRDIEVVKRSSDMLRHLIRVAERLNIRDVVVPLVDRSSLNGQDDVKRLQSSVIDVMQRMPGAGVNISLETDLPPDEFSRLIDSFGSANVTVNYDIGNSASLGFSPAEELDAYGDKISDIHIKDRILNGGSVLLGTGDADFDTFFEKLASHRYGGPFIMQSYRDDEGVRVFVEQYNWIMRYINEFNSY